MAPVDVVLIGGIHDRPPVGGQGHVLHLEPAGREELFAPPRCRHRVEVRPAVALPGKDEPIAGPPPQLARRLDAPEGAAPSGSGSPHLPRRSRSHVDHPDGPRLRRPPGNERQPVPVVGNPDERDPPAVRRPDRTPVAIHRRVQIPQAIGLDIVDTDETVISPPAHEGQPRAVGRPPERTRTTARREQPTNGRGVVQPRGPDSPPSQERHQAAVGRHRRIMTLGHSPRRAALHRHRPDGSFGTVRHAARIGDLPLPVGRSTADIHHLTAVGCERRITQHLAVVAFVGGEATAVEGRSGGHPDVAHAFGVLHPGDELSIPGRHEIRREGRAEHLLQGEPLLSAQGSGGQHHRAHGNPEGSVQMDAQHRSLLEETRIK